MVGNLVVQDNMITETKIKVPVYGSNIFKGMSKDRKRDLGKRDERVQKRIGAAAL